MSGLHVLAWVKRWCVEAYDRYDLGCCPDFETEAEARTEAARLRRNGWPYVSCELRSVPRREVSR